MSTEQLGTGPSDGNVIPGDLTIVGALGANGKTPVDKTTINVVTTAVAAAWGGTNSIITALQNLGLVVPS